MHDAAVDVVEYLPAAHPAQVVAPALAPVFVIDPALQSVHGAVDAVENLPAPHAVHMVAPAKEPVFVTDPAAQSEQNDLPPSDWYWPAVQAVHFAAFVADEDWPAGQLLHVCVELSAYVPGEQSEQKPSNDFAQDCRAPAEHFAHVMQLAWLVRFWY